MAAHKGRDAPRHAAKHRSEWQLQEAKARLSELVKRAQTDGPQHVTVHGRECVVIVSEQDYARLVGAQSGKLLVELLSGSPLADIEIEHAPVKGPVRAVDL